MTDSHSPFLATIVAALLIGSAHAGNPRDAEIPPNGHASYYVAGWRDHVEVCYRVNDSGLIGRISDYGTNYQRFEAYGDKWILIETYRRGRVIERTIRELP